MLVISGGENLLLNVLSGKGHHDWMLITSSNADSHLVTTKWIKGIYYLDHG